MTTIGPPDVASKFMATGRSLVSHPTEIGMVSREPVFFVSAGEYDWIGAGDGHNRWCLVVPFVDATVHNQNCDYASDDELELYAIRIRPGFAANGDNAGVCLKHEDSGYVVQHWDVLYGYGDVVVNFQWSKLRVGEVYRIEVDHMFIGFLRVTQDQQHTPVDNSIVDP